MKLRTLLRTAVAAVLLSATAHAHITVIPTQTGTAASGTATLGATFFDHDCLHVGWLSITAASLSQLPPPGIPLPTGGLLLIAPDPVFNITLSAWGTQVVSPACLGIHPEVPIPASAAGLPLHFQSVTLEPGILISEVTPPFPYTIL